MQLDLYNNKKNIESDSGLHLPPIIGLHYVDEFITKFEHDTLWSEINKSIWLSDIKRRVQHYGYKYDYKKRRLDYSMYLGELPYWAKRIAERIVTRGHMFQLPDQLIVNEYKPGQGIADHVDCEPCFEDTIISLSLGSPCVMGFKNKLDKNNRYEMLLEPRSLVVIKGDARYNWTHGIAAREKDRWLGKAILRSTRISLTFRKVILDM